MAIAQYSWKSTEELNRKNAANTMARAMQGGSAPVFGGAAPAPAPASPSGGLGAAPGAMPAPSAGVTPFAVPKTMAEAMRAPMPSMQSNLNLAQQNIAQGFQPAPTGPADDLARNELQKTLDANKRATMEQSALAGRGRTGQINGDLVNYLQQSAVPAKMDLEANLQANRMKEDTARAQNAQGNLQGLAGLQSQESLARAQIASQEGMQQRQIASAEKLGAADLSMREKELAQAGSNFKDELAFKKYATDAGFTDAEAQRAWQSKENTAQRASTEKLGFADLSLRESALKQEASNFTDELAFKKYATDRGFTDAEAQRSWQATQNEKEISSREKLGFADLSVREKQLAQEGANFGKELDFKKYATDRGFTDAEAQRAWQSKEADKEIASREKVSFAQLSEQEKELSQKASQFTDQLSWDKEATRLGLDDKTAERVWQGTENQKEREARASDSSLNRELQKYLGEKGLDLDEQKIAEQVREFDNKQDFDKWATQAGLDEQSKDRIWKSQEADVQRKWETDAQMSAQDHQVNLARLSADLDTGKMQLQNVLDLRTQDKVFAHDKLMQGLAQDYQADRDERQMTHEQAMEKLKADYTSKLQAQGYSEQQALQAADIQAKSIEAARARTQENTLAEAEILYKYRALADQKQLSREEIQVKKDGLAQDMALGLKQLKLTETGQALDEKRINAAIQSQVFQDRSGVIATFMEMSGDDKDALDKASSMFLDLMGDSSIPGGALLTPAQVAAAKAAMGVVPPTPNDKVTINGVEQEVDRGSGPFGMAKDGIETAGRVVGGAVSDGASAVKRIFSSIF